MQRRCFLWLGCSIGYVVYPSLHLAADPIGRKDFIVPDVEADNKKPKTTQNLSVVSRIDVHVASQLLIATMQSNKQHIYPISTAVRGIGNKRGSLQTPLGRHQVCAKFGDNAASGSIFVQRKMTHSIANIITTATRSKQDYVTSRILWLDGLEMDKNKGGDVDSKYRYIYIHGTHEEGLIGTPASKGCIRMKNRDIIELYQHTPLHTLVEIHRI